MGFALSVGGRLGGFVLGTTTADGGVEGGVPGECQHVGKDERRRAVAAEGGDVGYQHQD